MKHHIFRDYDIRGILNEDFSTLDIYYIGYLFAQHIKQFDFKTIAIARDIRLTSLEISHALVQGILDCNINVLDCGIITTPMLYWATINKNIKNCIMITASHNPKEYNGLKFMFDSKPFFNEQIQSLIPHKRLIDNLQEIDLTNKGNTTLLDIENEYVTSIMSKFNFNNYSTPMKILIDPLYGTTCNVLRQAIKLLPENISVQMINNTCNGNFPNSSPDPSHPKNLAELSKKMSSENFDIAISFDCDGDRILVIDKDKTVLFGDQILYMILKDNHFLSNETVVLDTKSSTKIINNLTDQGFNVIISKTGNPYLKQLANQHNAIAAAEVSGHIFFKEWFNIDDAIFAMFKTLESILKNGSNSYKKIPTIFRTSVANIDCSQTNKDIIFDKIELFTKNNTDKKQKISYFDGIRIENKFGIILIRKSNTENTINISIETFTQENIEQVKSEINALLKNSGIEIFII